MAKAPINFRILKIKNLPENATVEDLTNLFGLDKTPFIKKWSCVQINGEGENRFAKIVSPDVVYDEVLKLNGIDFAGTKLIIEGEADEDQDGEVPSSTENATPSGDENANSEATDNDILFMLLNCRRPEWNFNPILEYEVCDALQLEFANDPHKLVKTLRGRDIGMFRIYSNDMAQYLEKKIVIRGHEISLTPQRKRKQQSADNNNDEIDGEQQHRRRNRFFDPDGLKIRIFDAWEPIHQAIPHQSFDDYFESIGAEMIKQTQPERCYNSRDVFNTNRFAVVKKIKPDGTNIDFGKYISVAGKSFKLSYKGIQKFCGLCNRDHGWDCPTKVRHDFMRQLRKDETKKAKIYSDSTLRHTNQWSLKTDVACMSGGGIGQICNAIPFDDPHDEVIIKAGSNEMQTDDIKEFVYTIQRAEEKLKALTEIKPVTLVLPPVPTNVPELIVKGKFMVDSFGKLDAVTIINLEEVDMSANDNHPSPTGTADIIKQINAVKHVVLKDCEEETVLPLKYRGVQALFKVGCRGCDNLDFTRALCDVCMQGATETDTSTIERDILDLTNQMFPDLPMVVQDDSEDVSVTGNKRTLSNSEENDDGSKAKNARSGSS